MADRSVAATDTMNDLRREFNGSARDVGDISNLLSASGFIASSTDVIEAILAINTCLLYTSPSPRDKRQSRMPSSA